ncbi:JmjC domain-containing protein [Streptomyces sp. NPDC014894]|uniref:JmjC domain-containing protein n=1 Tax=unclassified Streptomyces TaxID=2593676 RepID=UPI0036FED5E7
MRYTALQHLVPRPGEFAAAPPESPRSWSMPAGPLTSLLGLTDIDAIVRAGLPADKAHVVQEGRVVDPARYAWDRRADSTGFAGQVRAPALARLLDEGATLVVQSLQHNHRPVGEFCARLEHETGQTVFAEAFLTPGLRPGLEAHHDEEDVFIVQTAGSKTWSLHEPVLRRPLQHETYQRLALDASARRRIAEAPPDLEVTLRPGDVLWIPRGWLHRGQATDTASLHVTIGFPVLTRYWLAQRIAERLSVRDPASRPLREELPWNAAKDAVRLAGLARDVAREVRDAVGALDPAELARDLADLALGGRREPDATASVTAGLRAREVGPETSVRLVPEAVRATTPVPGRGVRVRLRDRSAVVPEPVGSWLHRRWEAGDETPVTAARLVPGLTSAAAVDAVRHLVRLGVLRPLDRTAP